MGDCDECILPGSAAFAVECFLTDCQVVFGMHPKWQLLSALRKVHKEDISKLQTHSSVKYLGAGIPQSEESLCDGERSLSSLSQSWASIAAKNACPVSWVIVAIELLAFSFVSTLHILPAHLFFWILPPAAAVSSWTFLGCCMLWSRAGSEAECSWSSFRTSEAHDFWGAGVYRIMESQDGLG